MAPPALLRHPPILITSRTPSLSPGETSLSLARDPLMAEIADYRRFLARLRRWPVLGPRRIRRHRRMGLQRCRAMEGDHCSRRNARMTASPSGL
jgi:hypothetical protein